MAQLASRQIAVYFFQVELKAGGQALNNGYQAGAMRLSGGCESKRHSYSKATGHRAEAFHPLNEVFAPNELNTHFGSGRALCDLAFVAWGGLVDMNRRRVLVLFALTGLVGALVTAAATQYQTASHPVGLPATDRHANGMALWLGPDGSPDDVTTIFVQTRAVITVDVAQASEVQLSGLGQSQPAEPGTAAVFDLLPDRPQKIDVTLLPLNRPPRTIATLLVAPRP
jgi:hypothetical protein